MVKLLKDKFWGNLFEDFCKNTGKMDTDGYVVVALSIDDRLKKIRVRQTIPLFFLLWEAGEKPLIYAVWPGKAEKKGYRVLVMTTTHMAVPEYFGVLEPDLGQVEKMLEKEGIAVAGCPAKEGKIAFRDWEFYEKAGKLADVILVEADGSKRLPVKVPGPKEPVIP